MENNILDQVQVHLVEHCNLNCKYCAHFSSIADEEYCKVSDFEKDIKRLSYLLNQNLPNLVLLGGEPLLHPDINSFFSISRKYFPNSNISLYTNGIMLNDMKESFWQELKENNIIIIPSVYPLKINWKSVFEKIDKYNVVIKPWYDSNDVITSENINCYVKDSFFKIALNESKWLNLDYSKCIMRKVCTTLSDGKLFPCCVIAYIRHFNKFFDKNFKVSESDYIDLFKIKDFSDIADFLNSMYPFCNYCFPFVQNNLKWECSSKHDISEWSI